MDITTGVVTILSGQAFFTMIQMASKAQQRFYDQQDRQRAREELKETLNHNHNETLNALSDVSVQPLSEDDKRIIANGIAEELGMQLVPIVKGAVKSNDGESQSEPGRVGGTDSTAGGKGA